MNTNKISGERLFLLYAFPCADLRNRQRKLSDEDLALLEKIVDGNQDPGHNLLNRCFPDAVKRFCDAFAYNPAEESTKWPVEQVQAFWRRHTGRHLGCEVKRAHIVSIGNSSLVVFAGGKRSQAFNRYGLNLSTNQAVFIHRYVVVEIE